LQKIITHEQAEYLLGLAKTMGKAGWAWQKFLPEPQKFDENARIHYFHSWQNLPEWQSQPIQPPKGQEPLTVDEIDIALDNAITARKGTKRNAQSDYSQHINHIFQPIFEETSTHSALLEAHTGTGKTLGYLIPAMLYAKKNRASIWVSTFTRNLQHQIYHEALALSKQHGLKIAIRKGRENYLCLLNYEQILTREFLNPSRFLIGLGLVARWISETKFGDMNGDDFPPWLEDLFNHRLAKNLADRKNGCIHHLCPHFKICFIEHSKINARQADLVISNHALSLNEAEIGTIQNLPLIRL